MKKAFFLDRDGTINQDFGFVGKKQDVVLLPGVGEAIKKIKDKGFLVIVISNQSGVARGYFTESDVNEVNEYINHLLSDFDVKIDKFYYCPHLIGSKIEKYNCDCCCRKPKTGLFHKAIDEFDIDVKSSFACGDKYRDVEKLEDIGFYVSHLGILDGKKASNHYNDLLSFVNQVV